MTASERARAQTRAAIDRQTRAGLIRADRAPVSLFRCPAHGSLVALDGDGRLLGRCDGCVEEAAQGLALINGATA